MVKISLQYNRWALAIGMGFMLIALLFQFLKTLKEKGRSKLCILSIISISFSMIAIWFLAFTIIPQVYAMTKEFVAFGEDATGVSAFSNNVTVLNTALRNFKYAKETTYNVDKGIDIVKKYFDSMKCFFIFATNIITYYNY